MAEIDKLAPFIIHYEAGVTKKFYESYEAFFNRAKEENYKQTNGTYRVSGDRGGMTVVGITSATYTSYLKRKGRYTSLVDAQNKLRNLDYATWKEILKMYFWEACKAEEIKNQSLANMIVDFAWCSGVKRAIKKAQYAVGVTDDGIMGPVTLEVINKNSKFSFEMLKNLRIKYIVNLCQQNPSQNKFLNGWINRINAIKYE